MLDEPVSLLMAAMFARCATTLVTAYAERLRARARAELLQAIGALPPGVEVQEHGPDSTRWEARTTRQRPVGAGGR